MWSKFDQFSGDIEVKILVQQCLDLNTIDKKLEVALLIIDLYDLKIEIENEIQVFVNIENTLLGN